MIKKLKKTLKNRLFCYCTLIFIFFLIISLLMPYGGDDWNNLLDGKDNSLITTIHIAMANYLTFEGRFFSRIFVGFFVPKQVLWSIFNALLMVFIFYVIVKIIKPKNKIILPLLVIALLFIDYDMFAQIYIWKTGNITYLFPMFYFFLILFYRKEIFNGEIKKDKWWAYLIFPILALPFCMFVENVSVGIIVLLFSIVVYTFVKYKKTDVLMLISLIFGIVGLILMLAAPGTNLRLDTTEFATLNIFEKIIYNIPTFINYTYLQNSFLILLFGFVLYYIVRKNIKNKILKLCLYSFIIVIPFMTAVIYIITPFTGDIKIFWRLLDSSLWYINVYWLIYTILLLFILIKYLIKEKKNLLFIILAITNTGAMMISPIWGGRTAFFTVLMLYITLLLIIDDFEIKNEKIYFVIMNILISIFMVLFVFYSFYCYFLNKEREEYINYQKEHNCQTIEVINLPRYYTWNTNPWGDGWLSNTFKRVVGIDENTSLKLVNKKDANKKCEG